MKARWGWLCVAIIVGLAAAGCSSSNSSSATIVISPTAATVLLGTSLQFIQNVTGSNNGVVWSVNGVANGNATVGTISSAGFYTAPVTRPGLPSSANVPIVFAMANASIPNSGTTGSVIELQSGFDFTPFAPGNTITVSGNSVAGWNGSFIIVAAGTLSNGNFGVQIGAQPGPPATGLGGTAKATPNITITAQVQQTNAVASATVTLDSGIRVAFTQPTCTIGTNEQFSFTQFVNVTGTSNQAVTWTLTGVGTIDSNSGQYTAPSSAGTATITATSVADPTETASATVTVITAVDPALTSMSPTTGAMGAAFQEIYLSGSNFICTTAVFVNNGVKNIPLPASALSALSSTSFLVNVPDSILSTQPASGSTVSLTFTVERKGGTPQQCTPSPCVLTVSPVRPALVAATPDSIQQPSGATFNVTLDGGYFGTTNVTLDANGSPVQGTRVVDVQFNGQTIAAPAFKSNGASVEDRELVLAVPASDVTSGTGAGPGLYPISVVNKVSGSANGSVAAVNLAVQPSATPTPIGPPPSGVVGVLTVGATGTNPIPSAAAINTATGVAVVANQGTNDITLVSLGSLGTPSLSITTASLCTGSLGSVFGSAGTPCSVITKPVSVAVDNLRNLALVANSGNSTLAVVDLSVPKVTALLTFSSADSSGNPFPLTPQAIGINPVSKQAVGSDPVSGRALVAFSTNISGSGPGGSNAGAILDMNQLQSLPMSSFTLATLPPAAVPSVVNINNGVNPHVAVSPRLNWALSTPGGAGSLSIVDLGRRVTNTITSISRTANVVAANTSAAPSLQVGQPVLVTGVADPSFDGIFPVTAVSNGGFQYNQGAGNGSSSGGTAAYANPVATLATNLNVRGVSLNDETAKALLVDPTNSVPAFVFNMLDQTSRLVNALPSKTNNVATAMNPLTNIAVIVNNGTNQASVVDPVTPAVLSSVGTGTFPVDVAIDPAANTALVVNQKDNTVSLFSLGTPPPQLLRSGAPQIVQSSFSPSVPAQGSSRVVINSTLSSAATASPQDQTVTLIGTFPSGSVPRLDGNCSAFTGLPTITNGGRKLTATISGTFLAGNGPRLYALDAVDSCSTPASFSNAAPLQVIQAVNLITGTGSGPGNCGNPSPQGVAVDAVRDVALVTEPGCSDVAMVSLSMVSGAMFPFGTGFGTKPELAVGTNPQGVAVYPQAGLAVVANAGSQNVSIVDVVNDDVATTFFTDPIPDGVAVNLGTGKAVVTANGASLVDTFPVSTTSQTPTTIGVQQGPSGVAIDPKGGLAVVANSSSNTASIVNLSTNTTTNTANSISFPQGVAFDPILDNFLITSGSTNQVSILNPNSVFAPTIRVGIDPSSIAYNFESGTLVTANNLSGTMTVVDFIDQTVRGVFSLPSSTQFAVDIHPQTNLAVVADPKDNQLLLVPLPH